MAAQREDQMCKRCACESVRDRLQRREGRQENVARKRRGGREGGDERGRSLQKCQAMVHFSRPLKRGQGEERKRKPRWASRFI